MKLSYNLFNADFQNPEKLCVKEEKQGRSNHKIIEADVKGAWNVHDKCFYNIEGPSMKM